MIYLINFYHSMLIFSNVNMSEPSKKRRRVELTLDDKVKLLKESESTPKPTLKVRKYFCSEMFYNKS